jgi:branched-chain amino acid aminotransferase
MPGSQDFTADPRNQRALIYLNGALVSREQARVSIFDGGFVVGDGVWEGVRLHQGTLLFLDAHLDRLLWGARRIRLDLGRDRHQLTAAIRETLAANQMHHGVHLRIMATRGEKTAANQDPRNAIGTPTIVIVAEYKVPDAAVLSRGLMVATSTVRCTPADMFDMRLNSHSRLNLITALLEAIDAGADEALMLDPHGFVSSCNATNFFIVRGGTVLTSRGDYCFNGITRGHVIDLCRAHGIPVELTDFGLDVVYVADEAFVTGTFGGVTPVRQVDGHRLGGDLPGAVTERLRRLYDALKDAQAGDQGR